MKSCFVLLLAAGAILAVAADEKASGKTGKDFEQHFLAMVPHHHQQAIEMAEVCEQKAANGDVKAFCTKLLASQRDEKTTMDGWRRSWYQDQGSMPKAEMAKMDAMHKKHMAELNAATGEKFDHAFLMAMTQHHRDGLPEMKACQTRAAHDELKQLCSKMTKAQEDDIAQMKKMMASAHKH